MSKQPETITITVATFYDRLAWLHWHGAYQEANAVAALAAWFDPPFRVDDARVERRVAKYITDAERQAEPVNWS